MYMWSLSVAHSQTYSHGSTPHCWTGSCRLLLHTKCHKSTDWTRRRDRQYDVLYWYLWSALLTATVCPNDTHDRPYCHGVWLIFIVYSWLYSLTLTVWLNGSSWDVVCIQIAIIQAELSLKSLAQCLRSDWIWSFPDALLKLPSQPEFYHYTTRPANMRWVTHLSITFTKCGTKSGK